MVARSLAYQESCVKVLVWSKDGVSTAPVSAHPLLTATRASSEGFYRLAHFVKDLCGGGGFDCFQSNIGLSGCCCASELIVQTLASVDGAIHFFSPRRRCCMGR